MESSYPSEEDREVAEQMLYYLHRAERIPVKEEDPYAHLPLMPGAPPQPQRRASTPLNFDTDTESDIAADIELRRKAVEDYDPGTESESSSDADGDGDGDELPSYACSSRRPLPSSSGKSSTLPKQDKGKGRAIDVPVHSSQYHASEEERPSQDEEENADSQKTVLASQTELQTPSARPFCPDCLHASAQTSPSTTPSPACICGPCLSFNRQDQPQTCLCLLNRSQITLSLSDLAAALSSAFLHKETATHGQRQIYSLVFSTLNSIQSNPRKAVAEFYGKERFRDWACYVDFWAAKNEDIMKAWMELQWVTFKNGEGLEMLTHRKAGEGGRGRNRA